eukprot:s2226_g9.t1
MGMGIQSVSSFASDVTVLTTLPCGLSPLAKGRSRHATATEQRRGAKRPWFRKSNDQQRTVQDISRP